MGAGDFESQNRLAALRKLTGWYTGKSTESPDIRRGLSHVRNAVVVINGADASECVPLLATEALTRGAIRVEIPLDKIRTSNEGDNPLYTRAKEIANRLEERFLQNPRLNVAPRHIWDAAVTWRMIGHKTRR